MQFKGLCRTYWFGIFIILWCVSFYTGHWGHRGRRGLEDICSCPTSLVCSYAHNITEWVLFSSGGMRTRFREWVGLDTRFRGRGGPGTRFRGRTRSRLRTARTSCWRLSPINEYYNLENFINPPRKQVNTKNLQFFHCVRRKNDWSIKVTSKSWLVNKIDGRKWNDECAARLQPLAKFRDSFVTTRLSLEDKNISFLY